MSTPSSTTAPAFAPAFESIPSLPLQLSRALLLVLVLTLPPVGSTAGWLFLAKQWLPLDVRLQMLFGVLVVQTMVSILIVGVVAGGFALLRRLPQTAATGNPRSLALVLLAVLAALGALLLTVLCAQLAAQNASGIGFDPMNAPYMLQVNLTVAGLLVAVREYGERGGASARALHESHLRRLALDAELSAARLRVLQAQVEPHFLFNSLANLRRLVRTDRDGARSMVRALLRYLEEALPRLREERTTLAREAELVRAYLAVHQVRMGERLQVTIDLPNELGSLELPPMLLLTLVENAIKHGLQPLVEGGSIRVSAARLGDRLELTVADTGRGMGSASGTGTGLANLRAQLKALYGSGAHLALHVNEPRGVVASITLPADSR